MKFDPQIIFFVVFALVAGNLVFKAIKNGGLKGALFGAKIEKTTGEVSAVGKKLLKSVLKVHVLRAESNEKLIGLELVTKSFASYQMLPITLSIEESKQLVTLLQEAIER